MTESAMAAAFDDAAAAERNDGREAMVVRDVEEWKGVVLEVDFETD